MTSLILAAEGGILSDLGINPKVVAVQIVIFVFTFFVLRRLLFLPIMRFMTEREAQAERAAEKIKADSLEAERLAKDVEAHLARIDKEAWERLQALQKEALEARAKLAAEAQLRAAQETKAALAVIAKERDAALAVLRKEVPELARQAAEKIVGVPFEPGTLESASKGGPA